MSWRVKILPFIDQLALYEQFKLDEPWDSEHNIQLLERMPAIYTHHSAFNPLEKLSALRVDDKRYMFGLAVGLGTHHPEALPADALEALLTRNRGESVPQAIGR